MDSFQIGDQDVSLGDAAKATKTAATLTKSLPGMTNPEGEEGGGSAEPAVCPTCNQKIVTNQPSGGGVDVGKAIDSADKAVNCCNKAFDCFGKANDTVEGFSG